MSEAMRRDIETIKTTLDKTVRNVVVEQARARGDIEWLKETMVTSGACPPKR